MLTHGDTGCYATALGSRKRGGVRGLLSARGWQRRGLDEHPSQAQETRQECLIRLFDCGSRIEDPDIQGLRKDRDEDDYDEEH